MSKPQVNSRVDPETKSAVKQLSRDRGYHNQSDAARDALEHGLKHYGYLDGVGLTPARRLARYVYRMLFHIAAVLLLLSIVTPLAFVLPAIGVFGGSVAMLLADRWVLRSIEPAVTNRLPRLEVSSR